MVNGVKMIVLEDNRAIIELMDKKLTIWLPKREDQEISNSKSYNRDNTLDYIDMITYLQELGFNNEEIQELLTRLDTLDA